MSADKLEARVSDLEQYFKMLVEMLRRHDDRFDEVQEAQSNADHRIAALADAQIHTEEALTQLTTRFDALTEAQFHTDEAITRLTGGVERLTENVDRLTGRVDQLAETVDRYIENRKGQG
jgi:chromosome segregation ATPase